MLLSECSYITLKLMGVDIFCHVHEVKRHRCCQHAADVLPVALRQSPWQELRLKPAESLLPRQRHECSCLYEDGCTLP